MQKEHIMKTGFIEVGAAKAAGSILITRTHLFAFRTDDDVIRTGGLLGGVVGALIGLMVDASRAKGAPPPPHLHDPDPANLDGATNKAVARATLLAKIPVTSALSVTATMAGFRFEVSGEEPIKYTGLIHKRKLGRFLEEHGIMVKRV
jgi:hypothetical protein